MSSGGSKQPSNTTTTTSTIPKYAEPYAMEMLGKTQALMQVPYQQYTGQRVAGLNPMQQQAYNGIAGMSTSPYADQGAMMAGLSGIGGLSNNRWTDPGVAGAYMSPYMQQVVRNQQQDAVRQADIASTKRGFEAATSGAFGGSRHALVDAEADRNLGFQLNDIQAKGLQDAYSQGQNTFNQDEARRLQGLGLTTQAAGTLGQLGSDIYNQQMGIYDAQQQSGSQMRDVEQQQLLTNWQDFMDRLNYPYQQMGFFSDLLHGLPTTQSSSMYKYTNPAAQTTGILGGLGSLFASGGGG